VLQFFSLLRHFSFANKHKNAVVVLQNPFNGRNYMGHDLLLKMAMANDYREKFAGRENSYK
jgi:hypothetical protein